MGDVVTWLDETWRRRQRTKNLAVALVLVALVVLFYLVTIVKMTGNTS